MGKSFYPSIYRFLLLAHRYLGIAIGVVMSTWCLSGFVMMYMPFPSVSGAQRIAALSELDNSKCCRIDELEQQALVDINRFSVEMMAGRPVLRIHASNRKNPIIDLQTGKALDYFSKEELLQGANQAHRELFSEQTVVGAELIESDQWTVTRFYDIDRPLLKVAFSDGAELYMSSRRGLLAQLTTPSERIWNWLGAIPHWLYPSQLRQHETLWANTVIVLSFAGVFLTVFGIYLGVVRFKKLPSGRYSPYRGAALWHHYMGLIFGLLVLTWVFSGLLSMNPWQLFKLGGGQAERAALTGVPLSTGDVAEFIKRLPRVNLEPGVKRIEGFAQHGRLNILITTDAGVHRVDPVDFKAKPISSEKWQEIAKTVARGREIQQIETLHQGDSYYYAHKNPRYFPVKRIVLDDSQTAHIYLHGESGEMVGYFDRDNRWYRWLFSGLHQLDLTEWLRQRPVWDVIVWFLLLGVSLVTLTGFYMGIKRLLR